jgi:hypothetical protein
MVPPDSYLKATAAAVSLAFGLVILAAAPRRAANQALALFFALIAGNQGLEALRTLAARAVLDLDQVLLYRAAHACSSLDPLLLLLFLRLRFGAGGRWRLHAALAAAGGALALLSFVVGPPEGGGLDRLVAVLDGLYSLAAYAAGIRLVVAARGTEGSRPELALLFVALCLIAMPVAFRAVWTLDYLAIESGLAGHGLGLVVPSLAVAAALALALPGAAWRRRSGWARGPVWTGAAAGLALSASLSLFEAFQLTAPEREGGMGALLALAMSGASIRWLLFGAIVSMAILRHGVLAMGPAARRRAARAVLAATFVATAASLADLLRPAGHGWGTWELALLLAAVLASQGFHRLLDRVTFTLYRIPLSGADDGLERYRRAAERLLAGDDPEGRAKLDRLRRHLQLDLRAAQVVERIAQASVGGQLQEGALLAGRYRALRGLDARHPSQVLLARDELLRRDVVVKRVTAPEGEEPPLAEARIAGRLQHPNIVTVHDLVRHGREWLLVTEHLPGGSLEAHLAREGPLPATEAAAIVDGVLAALEAVHERGVVHCDLKPANILLGPAGQPKIADFGIARGGPATVRLDRGAEGTPGFMAPEQAAGGRVTPGTDLYAVGVLLGAISRELPPSLRRVQQRACQPDPGRRWRSARQMREALRQALSGTAAGSARRQPRRLGRGERPTPWP